MDSERDDGVLLEDAARQLHMSVAALRKRVQRGSVTGYKRAGRWYVLRPAPLSTESGHQRDTVQPEVDTNEPLVAQLRQENAWLRAEVERKDTLLLNFAQRFDIIEGAVKQIPAITEPAPTQKRRWWRFWS